jgi:hypothetical protein
LEPIHIATVEGLGKKGNQFQFLISVPAPLQAILKPGSSLVANDVPVVLKDCDGEYASFELSLSELMGSELAQAEVGSSVALRVDGLP